MLFDDSSSFVAYPVGAIWRVVAIEHPRPHLASSWGAFVLCQVAGSTLTNKGITVVWVPAIHPFIRANVSLSRTDRCIRRDILSPEQTSELPFSTVLHRYAAHAVRTFEFSGPFPFSLSSHPHAHVCIPRSPTSPFHLRSFCIALSLSYTGRSIWQWRQSWHRSMPVFLGLGSPRSQT